MPLFLATLYKFGRLKFDDKAAKFTIFIHAFFGKLSLIAS